MSFSVDQFMQVKCKFQLTSETESSESIHSNNERVRLCTSVDLDRNTTLIVMVCSNETGNNHVVAYYIERRIQTTLITAEASLSSTKLNCDRKSEPLKSQANITHSQAIPFVASPQQTTSPSTNQGFVTRTKPRIIVKQIYYHTYNEDIVAICLSDSGNKLALISASSTIYILPIKNILLNLHAKQLRSSQGKSMYFYDASIIDCCSLDDPVDIVYWESLDTENQSTIMVANQAGKISFISVEEKSELTVTSINERVRYMKIIRDRYSYSLLITSDSFKQYRFTLESIKQQEYSFDLSPNHHGHAFSDEYIFLEKDFKSSMDRKPIPIKLSSNNLLNNSANSFHRALVPTSRNINQANLFNGLNTRDRSLPLIFNHPMNMICVVDILGVQKSNNINGRIPSSEPRLLRFFSSKQFYYKPQKPILVCKLNYLNPNEMIIHLVLTDRFLAIATDRDRCLINSRNCCNLRNSNSTIELDPVVKEITFNNEEKILSLLKSPVTNDPDNIIDSFLLITTRSIYSIEARQSCRDMFVNLIDTHLGIKPSRSKQPNSECLFSSRLNHREYTLADTYSPERKNSESKLMVSNFLSRRGEVYERITYDSKAFSILFKLELSSLYEAYGDKLIIRNQFELANRFFQMAKFDHTKTLGKYIRLCAYNEMISYVTNVLSDENEIMDETERIDLAKAALDCLLAKTIVERSKSILFNEELKKNRLKKLVEYRDMKTNNSKNSPIKRYDPISGKWAKPNLDPYMICEHSPRGKSAKLSANTIIVEDDDDATMTTCLAENRDKDAALECEKTLICFVKNLMPSSLYPYILTQLVDFDLIDLADKLARSSDRIGSLVSILLRVKDDNRVVFRDGRFEGLTTKLNLNDHGDLIRIDSSKPKFLEFITSPEVTKALVEDRSLTGEYIGHQQNLVQYSYAALNQFEAYRKLVLNQRSINQPLCMQHSETFMFTKEQKQTIEYIFIEFLNACMSESSKDTCRLWSNYINFYLNYIGDSEELEIDILKLLDLDSSDCRLAITLFKAIGNDENGSLISPQIDGDAKTPLGSMKKFFNLSELFENEFLMKLLEKTLDLLPRSADLNAVSNCLEVDGLMDHVPLPVENDWRQIFKTIQSAALSTSTE